MGRRRRWIRLQVVGLVLTGAAAVGCSSDASSDAGSAGAFCTDDAFILDDGTRLHRDHQHGCRWVDDAGRPVTVEEDTPPNSPQQNDADAAMEQVRVAPGWGSLAGSPPEALERPAASASRRDLVEVTRFWRSPDPVETELERLRADPPGGFGAQAEGNSGGTGRAEVRFVVLNDLNADPDEDEHTYLVFSLAADPSIGTVIRVDAQVSSSPTHF